VEGMILVMLGFDAGAVLACSGVSSPFDSEGSGIDGMGFCIYQLALLGQSELGAYTSAP
jgi:hypothetical protein